MFNNTRAPEIEGWVCLAHTASDLEAQMMQNFLQSQEIECQILSKRDSAYSLNVGDMAHVFVYVPVAMADEAREALDRDFSTDDGQFEEE